MIDAGCYFLSAAAFALLRPSVRPIVQHREERVPYLRAIGAAVREVRALPGARAAVVIPPLLVMAGTAAYVLGVALIENQVEKGTMIIGFLTGLVGLGMAVGSYFTGNLFRGASRQRIALVAASISVVSLVGAGLTQQILLVGAAVIVAGIAAGPVFVASETAIQEEAKSYRQATTFAVRDTLMKMASAVSALLAPAVATAVGLRPAMVLLLVAVLPLMGLSGLVTSTRRRS
jgi:predicted MFS family arabinose efflux permease